VCTLYPPAVRIGIVLDNYSPHLSTRDDPRVGDWAKTNNVELAYVPTDASWLNRIEAQFSGLRYFSLDGTDHGSHAEQGLIRRYIAWRNRHARDVRLQTVLKRARLPDEALAGGRTPSRTNLPSFGYSTGVFHLRVMSRHGPLHRLVLRQVQRRSRRL
jgi:hypothetical protein